MTDFLFDRSRAEEPMFYQAPTPANVAGNKQPFAYQHAGVEYCLYHDHALIGDAPGLGKTIQGILVSNAIEAKRTLVVCPASLRLNWEREIWLWSTIENVKTYPILSSKDGTSNQHDYLIISYDLLRNKSIMEGLLDQRWDHLILDEAHLLKDPKGNQRTRMICAPDMLPSVVGRVTMLSGTILPNQPIECYNACRLLNWDAIDRMSLETFRNTYYEEGEGFVTVNRYNSKGEIVGTQTKWSSNVRNRPINLEDLQYRLRRNIMVRRLRKDVLPQLPPRQWQLVPMASNAAIRKALKHPGWAKAEEFYMMNPNVFNTSMPIDGAIATARRLLGEAKAPLAVSYIRDLIESGVDKIVVGAFHIDVLALLREKLAKHGLVYMDGRTTPKQKQQAVDMFQENDEVKIILGQIGPLGMGWSLTRAKDVVLVEPDWVSGNNGQLLDRVIRPGQVADAVLGHVCTVPDSMDERIIGRAIEKDIDIHNTLDRVY